MQKNKPKVENAIRNFPNNKKQVIIENEEGLEQHFSRLTKVQRVIIMTLISHDFVKGPATEFADQLDQFSNALNGATGPTALATKYGYTTAQLKEIKMDAAYFRYWFTKHDSGDTYKKGWVRKGDEIRKGSGTSITAWPVGTDVSTPPQDVLPGVESRFREEAKRAKSQTRIYTEGDGVAMGIEVNSTVFVPADGKPDLILTISGGGHPMVEYVKSKYVGINLYKDAGDGTGWKLLLTCNDSSCSDMSPLPEIGKSAIWSYKASYLYGGKEIGTISKIASITVTGF